MKHQTLPLIALLFAVSCNTPREAHPWGGDLNGSQMYARTKGQEAIAMEIVSNLNSFGKAMLQLNNINAPDFAAKVGVLTDRLEKISKELDRSGAFSPGMREATIRKLQDDDKAFLKTMKSIGKEEPLSPEAAKIIVPAVDRFFSTYGCVIMKAGLLIEAK